MRVLHLYQTYLPDSHGGIPKTINALARAGKPLGIEATVLTLGEGRENTKSDQDGHTVYRAKRDFRLNSAGVSISALRQFAALARETDIVHYHFPWPFMDIVHFAARVRKPTVLTYHSDIVKQQLGLLLYRPLMSAFLSSVDRIVATSPNYLATSEVLQKHRGKVSIIPIGLDRSFYPPVDGAAKEAWRQRFGDRFFLFTGVLRYYKGLDVLLDAAKRVDFPIVIVGDGPLGPEVRRRAAEERIANVHFVGTVEDADKLALLELCLALVFPSNLRSEAFGLSLVEASMLGKPMLTCEIGTGTSYVNLDRVTGLVVPPNDPETFASAMTALARTPGLAAGMGARAARRSREEFSANLMAKRYLDLYRDVIGARSPD